MASIILNTNGLDASQAQERIAALRALTNLEIIVLSRANEAPGVTAVELNNRTLAEALQAAAKLARGTKLIILAAEALQDTEGLARLLETVENSPQFVLAYAPLQLNDEYIDLGWPSLDSIVNTISSGALWPTAGLVINKALLEQIQLAQENSAAELLGSVTVQSLIKNISIDKLPVTISLAADSSMAQMTKSEQARVLSLAVNSFNIEELFPNHAWEEHSEESAAAAYHTLAAIFIRLGDYASAEQCLSFSDRLEDSPRSLALKAIIALAQGETLGAVANMVSSLQQYEQRKKNENNRHYLSFTPTDFEVVNTSLRAGLSALNKRDNSSAFEYFATAVFSFDPFYSEQGVDRLAH